MDGGDKSGKITYDTSSKRKNSTLPIKTKLDQAIAESGGSIHRFGGFTGRNSQEVSLKTSRLQGF